MFDIKLSLKENTSETNCGTFLQTPFWCEFKSRHGWNHLRFIVEYSLNSNQYEQKNDCTKSPEDLFPGDLHRVFEMEVLYRGFAKNLFSIAYIPLKPDLPFECTDEEILNKAFDDSFDNSFQKDDNDAVHSKTNSNVSVISQPIMTAETQAIEFAHLLSELAEQLKVFLPENTIVIRFDPDVNFSDIQERDTFNFGIKTIAFADKLKLKKNTVDIQPPDTTILDLTQSEEEILANMHSKWRYNIRLSEKKGVKIHKYDGSVLNLSEKVDIFYRLTQETVLRDGNSCHSKEYYLDLLKFSAQNISEGKDVPLINLYIAEHENDEIGAIITLFSKDEAVYLYGASSNLKRNLMPNYLLQWTAIKDAKNYGSKIYDFYGISPEGKKQNHPMHGLYMFKTNFGGKIIHRTGSWNIPLKKIYFIFSLAEKIRAFWFKKVIKKFKRR